MYWTLKSQDVTYNLLNRAQLMKLKLKAIRAGVWYKALPRIDRVIVDLTIKVAENIRSALLAKSILAVMSKLEGLLESRMSNLAKTVGRAMAEKTSLLAQKWGNRSARAWAADSSFAYFLAVMHANT